MKTIFEGVWSQRRAVAFLFAALVVAGVASALRMPDSILPEITFPRITIIADAGEQPSDVMLRRVTIPVETAVRRVPGVREVRSTTSRGSAEINLDCSWNTDMNLALQRVQGEVETVRPTLPAGTSLEARLMNPTLFPIVGFSLTSDQASLAKLRDFGLFVANPALSRLPGVAEVAVQGGRQLEARVTLDPAALAAHGLDAAAVAEAIRNSASLESFGLIEANSEFYLGLADGRAPDLERLKAFAIPVRGGPPVRLDQLGRIRLEDAPEYVRFRAHSREAVLINLMRRPSASAIEISDAAHAWFAHNRRLLPPGTHIETFYDQSELVHASILSVRDSLLVGVVLAAIIVILFLQNVRMGLAAAVILPGSIAMTLVGLQLGGQSLDMMTLGGIAAAVGLVLDDAIVVVEHVRVRMSGASHYSRAAAVSEIAPVLVGSSLCTLAILLPFVFLDGVAGAFFKVLTLSMAWMLASSLVLCLTVVPLLIPGEAKVDRGRVTHPWFERALGFAVRRKWFGPAMVVVAIGVAVPLQGTLGSEFLPAMDEGSLIMDYVSPPGTSLEATDHMLQIVEQEIERTPEIASWSRRTGTQLGFFITEPNTGDYVLRLRKHRDRSAEEVADELRTRVARVEPALEVEFGQLIEDVVGDLTTSPQPIEIRLFSEDRALVESLGRRVADLIATIPGVVDVRDGVVVSGPGLIFEPNATADRLGLKAADIAAAARPAVSGIDAGAIQRGVRAWPIRVTIPMPPAASGRSAIERLPVPTGNGPALALGAVAKVTTLGGETEITRDNLRTMVAVSARLAGRDLGSAMSDIRRRMRRSLALPAQVHVEYGGLFAQQQSSFRGLMRVLLFASVLVMLILLISFRSWGMVAAVLLVVLGSLAGVLGALHLGGATFNISSYVGAIMIVGIVAENAYFVVHAYRSYLGSGMTPPDAATAAARRRARPVLMTTLAGVAALAPLALGIGAGSALLKPLAIAVVGGIVTSAFLLLLALPSLLALSDIGREVIDARTHRRRQRSHPRSAHAIAGGRGHRGRHGRPRGHGNASRARRGDRRHRARPHAAGRRWPAGMPPRRETGIETPILSLTARIDVAQRIEGLDASADDYMRKPFALAELQARLRALARRHHARLPPGSSRVRCRSISRPGGSSATDRSAADGARVAVLEVMTSHAGRIVRRTFLLETLWGNSERTSSESLDVILSRLRRKIASPEGVMSIARCAARGSCSSCVRDAALARRPARAPAAAADPRNHRDIRTLRGVVDACHT